MNDDVWGLIGGLYLIAVGACAAVLVQSYLREREEAAQSVNRRIAEVAELASKTKYHLQRHINAEQSAAITPQVEEVPA